MSTRRCSTWFFGLANMCTRTPYVRSLTYLCLAAHRLLRCAALHHYAASGADLTRAPPQHNPCRNGPDCATCAVYRNPLPSLEKPLFADSPSGATVLPLSTAAVRSGAFVHARNLHNKGLAPLADLKDMRKAISEVLAGKYVARVSGPQPCWHTKCLMNPPMAWSALPAHMMDTHANFDEALPPVPNLSELQDTLPDLVTKHRSLLLACVLTPVNNARKSLGDDGVPPDVAKACATACSGFLSATISYVRLHFLYYSLSSRLMVDRSMRALQAMLTDLTEVIKQKLENAPRNPFRIQATHPPDDDTTVSVVCGASATSKGMSPVFDAIAEGHALPLLPQLQTLELLAAVSPAIAADFFTGMVQTFFSEPVSKWPTAQEDAEAFCKVTGWADPECQALTAVLVHLKNVVLALRQGFDLRQRATPSTIIPPVMKVCHTRESRWVASHTS